MAKGSWIQRQKKPTYRGKNYGMEILNQGLLSGEFARITSIEGCASELSGFVVRGPAIQVLLQMSVVEVLLYKIQKHKEKALNTYQANTIRPASNRER
jgi:hypothetical protein